MEECVPRLASRQQHRPNIQAGTSNDFYRLNLAIPLLDHLINEMQLCFEDTYVAHLKTLQNSFKYYHLPLAIPKV